MRLEHFEALRPICPACRLLPEPIESPVELSTVLEQVEDPVAGEHVVAGLLVCPNSACQREYPIIDGVPILVRDVRSYVASQWTSIVEREDLDPVLESLIGDCCGPASVYDIIRQQVSSYAWDHYGDLDPSEVPGEAAPGGVARLVEHAARLMPARPSGPILDIGCATGRGCFAWSDVADGLVLGIDLNFALLRLASHVLRGGEVRYPRRRVGVVYDERRFPVELPGRSRVDFWACDALALPLGDATFGTIGAFNVIDSTTSPVELLQSIDRALIPGGHAVLVTPYDWTPGATPIEGWLGGHSQRSPDAGDSAAMLRRMFGTADRAGWIPGLEHVAEADEILWSVRLHERAVTRYREHLLLVRKRRDG